VWERDGHRCVLCGRWVPVDCACAHYIARSQLGKGIVENIITLCGECHTMYDNSEYRKPLRERLRKYLKSKHINWNEKKLVYSKWEVFS